jgi:hypothetical protein
VRVTPFLIALAAVGAPLLAPTAVQASANDDARCLLTMVALSHDEKYVRLAQAAIPFFAGRIRAQDPNYNFANLKTVAAGFKQEELQGEAQRCGPMAVDALNSLSAALAPPASAKAPAQGAKPAKPAAAKPAAKPKP